jgi:chromosome segregation ATPase
MFGIVDGVKLIGGLVLAGVLVFAGYSFGGRQVTELKSQLENIRKTGVAAEQALEKTKTDMASMLKTRDEEHAKRLQDMQVEFDRRAKSLTEARKGTAGRIEAGQANVKALEAKMAALRRQMEQASAADKQKLQDQLAALDKDKNKAVATVDSNRCLAMAVPDAIVTALIK